MNGKNMRATAVAVVMLFTTVDPDALFAQAPVSAPAPPDRDTSEKPPPSEPGALAGDDEGMFDMDLEQLLDTLIVKVMIDGYSVAFRSTGGGTGSVQSLSP
jgi:hypothetical protein